MLSDRREAGIELVVATEAGNKRHVWADDAQLRMGCRGHWCGGSDGRTSGIGEDGEVGIADVFGVPFTIICCGGATARTRVERKHEAEVDTGIGDEVFLFFLETDRLRSAARSESGRHVQDMVLAGEVIEVDHFAALVDECNVAHHVAQA